MNHASLFQQSFIHKIYTNICVIIIIYIIYYVANCLIGLDLLYTIISCCKDLLYMYVHSHASKLISYCIGMQTIIFHLFNPQFPNNLTVDLTKSIQIYYGLCLYNYWHHVRWTIVAPVSVWVWYGVTVSVGVICTQPTFYSWHTLYCITWQ